MDRPSNSTSVTHSDKVEASSARILLCSIPKSGTYLLGRLFEELGLINTGLHISRGEASLYQHGDLQAYRTNPERFRINQPFGECVAKILPGQFAVSHLPCDTETKKLASELRVIFLHRSLRDCLISLMRFIADSGRDASFGSAWIQKADGPDRMVAFLKSYDWFCSQWVEPLLAWESQPGVLSVSYEDLMGDSGSRRQLEVLRAICSQIGINPENVALDEVLRSALNVSTLTWSGDRSRRDHYWSDEAEAIFKKMKGVAANRRLGYDLPQPRMVSLPKLMKRLRFVN